MRSTATHNLDLVDRRDFFRTTAVALGAAGLNGCAPAESVQAPASPPELEFELQEATVDGLQEMMSSGKRSGVQIVQLYLDRIDQLDGKLRSVIETNPAALALAEELDRERQQSGPRGPLHGIPVLLKDNIDTADRMTTTAGSLALEGSIPAQDSGVAQRLRQAGAVILGKANLSEWANFRSNRSSSGWSARGGQCRNPYVLSRNPCGSSSGSAVAVSANLSALAVGTETDGSIVCPSHVNGIVGIKPTLGRVSRSGIIPVAHSQDTAGPMARTVRDAAILLQALCGDDARDPTTQTAPPAENFVQALKQDGLQGKRIGVCRRFFEISPVLERVMEDSLDALRQAGATLVDPADLPHHGQWRDPEFEVLLYEFKADLNRYLAALGPTAPVKSLQEIIDFNRRHADREMPFFGQELMERAQAKGSLDSPAYLKALAEARRLTREEGIDQVLAANQLDALLAPTGGPAWTTDLVNGDHYSGGSSGPAAVAGYPAITVPAGMVWGLPIGISFFGRAWSEPLLLEIAYGFEQLTAARRPPTFLADLEGV